MEQNYVNRENYEKTVGILGNECIFNCSGGNCEDFTSDTRIDINNSEGKAAEVLERIVEYADALLYDAYYFKPDPADDWKAYKFGKASDVFDFIIEDTRYTLEIDHMAHNADDIEWEEWKVVREKILHANKASVEYWYSIDAFAAEALVDHALKRMLDDLLADAQLADCVSMQMRILKGDILFANEPAREMKGCSYLWMNGMRNGQYFCGEIPFESNEDAIRSCSGWQEDDDGDLEEGLFLQLHPETSQTLLKRVCEETKEFAQKVDCKTRLMLSYNDFRNEYLDFCAAGDDSVVSCVDKAVDDKQQRKFPDLRVYFTAEEKRTLMDKYAALSKKFIQYADSSYTEDELERIRFLWTLVLMEIYEGPKYIGIERRASKEMDAFLKVFYALPEDVRLKLYGFCDYEKNPFSEEGMLVKPHGTKDEFLGKHSGIGDLSIMDDELYARIRSEGYFVQVNEIHLKDIDDVHMMCDFMNKLKEIERLAQAETGEPISRNENDERFDGSLAVRWLGFASRWGQEEGIPEMTIREYHEQAFQNEPKEMNRLNVYGNDDITFEPDESSLWARLRFRLENGKYIYEIAQAEI